ncbi:MAG: hypothetical protein U1F43_05135 [Myxococcota bacterium]
MLGPVIMSLALGAPPPPPVTAYSDLVREPANQDEHARVESIIDRCPRAARVHIDPFAVLALVRLEEELGVPTEARGLLPAVWCIESAFRPAERLFGDMGAALGPAQFHEQLAAWCMGDYRVRGKDWRGDFVFSARCWVAHVMRNLDRARARCGPDKAWQVAEAVVANPARYGWRCAASSEHWKLAETFRAALAAAPN